MKERPIIFSDAMVRAILDGRKTQTRRIAKPRKQPSLLSGEWSDSYVLDVGNREWLMRDFPYGQISDRLWVRECFCENYSDDTPVAFRTDFQAAREFTSDPKWRPSIHMPRWASRITLEITGVRVERLQDISEEDAISEGCTIDINAVEEWRTNRISYSHLWDGIYGEGRGPQIRECGWLTSKGSKPMISYETQRRIVAEYSKHGSHKTVSRITGVHYGTCAKIVHAYERFGESLFSDYPVEVKR